MRDLFCSLALPADWKQEIGRQTVMTEGPSVPELEERRRRLARAYGDGGYTHEEYEQKLEELDTELRLAQLAAPVEIDEAAGLLEDLPVLWSEATPDERGRLLRTLIEGVYVDMKSKRVVGVTPVPAFKALIEAGIQAAPGSSAILVDPEESGEPGSMVLVETGENRTPRPDDRRHGSATGVVSGGFSPASPR